MEDAPSNAGTPAGRSTTRPRTRVLGRLVVAVGVAAAGAAVAVLALDLVPGTRGEVGPGEVELSASWRPDGTTDLRVPPLGSVSADTHAAPVRVVARVEELDLDRLQGLAAADEPRDRLYEEAEGDLRTLVRKFVVRVLLGAAVLGAVTGALLSRVRPTLVAAGAVGGVLAVGVLLLLTWRGFDARAFAEPRYEGALERAPEVLETARRHVADFGAVRRRVDVLATQISDLYAVAAGPAAPSDGPDDTRILHVSDLHLNPLGVEVARRLADRFDVDAVLDTGDLTTFGLPVEAQIGRAVSQIGVPYLFVPGNHDSDENRAALAAMPNVRLVDGVERVGNIHVLGVPDPTFTADNQVSSVEARRIRREHAADVRRRTIELRPDLLAVHDPVLAERSHGLVPLVLAGHLHERQTRLEDGTIVLVVGSTGATGLGSFTVDEDLPLEAQVLHFSRDGCLAAQDALALSGLGGGFELERRVFDLQPSDEGARRVCAAVRRGRR